jgi:hypothetical protein
MARLKDKLDADPVATLGAKDAKMTTNKILTISMPEEAVAGYNPIYDFIAVKSEGFEQKAKTIEQEYQKGVESQKKEAEGFLDKDVLDSILEGKKKSRDNKLAALQDEYEDTILHELRHRGATKTGGITWVEKLQALSFMGYKGEEAIIRAVDAKNSKSKLRQEAEDYFKAQGVDKDEATRRAADISELAISILSKEKK